MKEIEEKFMTQGKFTSLVESRVKDSQGLINYIEAVTSICEEFEIEVETESPWQAVIHAHHSFKSRRNDISPLQLVPP